MVHVDRPAVHDCATCTEMHVLARCMAVSLHYVCLHDLSVYWQCVWQCARAYELTDMLVHRQKRAVHAECLDADSLL